MQPKSSQRPAIELRDPVHGAIPVRAGELAVIDTPIFQRLRGVRQLGFAEHVFPGAVHHRYLHSIGAMHLAGEVMDKLLGRLDLSPVTKTRLVQAARLAALLHDVGHPPLSHAAESLLPTRQTLLGPGVDRPDELATHEDMTELILSTGALRDTLDAAFADLGITARDISRVIMLKRPDCDAFREGGVDYGPLLHQLVSGELDVDRMDYLLRDSHFTGVRYGTYDRAWIVSNIETIVDSGIARLALDIRALPSFEHFLLARYHMFQMVYFHPISDAYDLTLRRYLASAGPEAQLPASLSEFVRCTDAWLRLRLESSEDPWARRLVERRPLALLTELRSERDEAVLRPRIDAALKEHRIDVVWHSAKPVLSRYAAAPADLRVDPLLVIERRPPIGRGPRISRIEEVTDLFDRYERTLRIARAYVLPEQRLAARKALDALD
jgi:HD superfamily phosphohydrolase